MSLCRICKNEENNKILDVKKISENSSEFCEYILCAKCRSLSIKNLPDNYKELYNEYYSFIQKGKIGNRSFFKKFLLAKILRMMKKTSIKNLPMMALDFLKLDLDCKILDVGCGSGEFIKELYRHGYRKILGIDPNLKEDIDLGENIKLKKLNLVDLNESFDVITLNHSLEHMNKIENIFHKISELLSNNGVCIIRIPNIESFSFRKFQTFWTGINPPYHFILPSIGAINNLCEKFDLKIFKIKGEQTIQMFIANLENQLNLADLDKIFGDNNYCNYLKHFTKMDLKYWNRKVYKIKKHPELCDWLIYYLKRNI
jgi:SAM-dependent methyltransferase